jgi:putative DNA primase/helicase
MTMTMHFTGADAEKIARECLGNPNPRLSKRHELHFDTGTYGTKVCIAGDKVGLWFDHDANEGGSTLDLIQRQTGLANGEAFDWLRGIGIGVGPEPQAEHGAVAVYHYPDEAGALLFQVVRYAPKNFVQRRRADDGQWIWGLKAGRYWLGKTGWKLDRGDIPRGAEVRQFPECPRVPYRLPELGKAVAEGWTIWIPEGEKDVESLRCLGFAATCNPGGKLKWPKEFSRWFAGARVVVVPDRDADGGGLKHARDIAAKLKGIAASVTVTPYVEVGKDVSEWIKAGADREALERFAESVGTADPAPEPEVKADDAPKADLAAINANEDAIALEFANRHTDKLRYCHDWGMWLRWDGARWERERRRLAFHFAREVAREANWEGKATPAKASTAAGVERFAQADPRLATISDEWDVDPWKLGTPGGTVNLRTGVMAAARQADHITKLTAVTPADPLHGDGCPQWLDFLHQATQGDKELIRFLQQMAGYCLTGDVSEECLFFVHGPGGNGKGVFLQTIGNILGDYAASAAMDTFTASHGDKHPTDLAKLRGARMVTASETEEGRAWAEARIKELTGNERPISARFMRQDFFEYWPTFKLVFVGNHQPVLRNVDDAARRRFNIIPFVHKPENPDKELKDKLRTEYPAILRWMIDGCLDWKRYGLIRPAVVVEATEEYFTEQDSLGRWIEELCDIGKPAMEARHKALFASWTSWAAANGEQAGTGKAFSKSLQKRGFKQSHDRNGSLFNGIELRPIDTSGQYQNRMDSDA